MSKLLEFFLGSILITVFTIAFMFFSALHYILRGGSVADCLWQASVTAWVDSNGNGLVEADEPPLSEVKIHLYEAESQLVNLSWPATTDKDGDAQLNIPIPGCVDTLFEISVDIPNGYRITTRPRIQVHSDIQESPGKERVYFFGFVADR